MPDRENDKEIKILSPVNGKAVPLDSVPDPVFADKVLGDGCGVIPSDGKIFSPVDGTVSSIADTKHVVEADYVGIVSGNKVPDKVAKAGLTTTKSAFVNAPIINEFPMTVECKLLKFNEDGICIGEIVNVSADEAVLGEDGQIAPEKLEAITYDPVHHTYIKLGEKVGNAFSDGKKLK